MVRDTSTNDELESIILNGSSGQCRLPLEYLRRVTNNFSEERLLGEGGFGKVYKAVLQNGKTIAVKRFDKLLKPGVQERQFDNEVYHLMRLKHPNIVRCLGYCYETQNEFLEHNGEYIFAEKQQKLVCLEYLENGSLDKHISDESSGHEWHTRYKIIKGICCGLQYLHEECQRQFSASIIHMDLKPANILLDENMGPKIADFGLSRLFKDNKTQTCATFLSGSLGYMAPEYLFGRVVTAKADIYNLGVIIIEIITGRKDIVSNFGSPTSYQKSVDQVLDNWRNRLRGAPSETDCEQIKFSFEIGIGCIKHNREERPTAREIIERLDRWETSNCSSSNNNNDEQTPAEQSNIPGVRCMPPTDNNRNTGAGMKPCGSQNRLRRVGVLLHRQQSRILRFMTQQMSSILMTRQRNRPLSFKRGAEEFTFAQLEAATKGFSLEAKIGDGDFGTVYHGHLPDGREVAIRRGKLGTRDRRFRFQQEREFLLEVAFLSRLHHKHIVVLIGYCMHKKECLRVCEYLKNGALYDHLHPTATSSSPSLVLLSWKQRIRILLDASRGIEYLHLYAVPPIIHRDIKSSNILLDANWTALVSSFGLSLIESEARAHRKVKAAGTMGYVDPEYYATHHLTVKSDMYGFGVVMLEMLTGRRAIFKETEGGSPLSIVDYAVPSIVSGEIQKVLDPRVPEPSGHEAEAVELVAYTAVHCVRLEGKYRPAMADIIYNLETSLALCEGSSDGDGDPVKKSVQRQQPPCHTNGGAGSTRRTV